MKLVWLVAMPTLFFIKARLWVIQIYLIFHYEGVLQRGDLLVIMNFSMMEFWHSFQMLKVAAGQMMNLYRP